MFFKKDLLIAFPCYTEKHKKSWQRCVHGAKAEDFPISCNRGNTCNPGVISSDMEGNNANL